MIPLTVRTEFDYVPLADRELPEVQRTIFVLRGLSARAEAHVRDSFGVVVQTAEGAAYRGDPAGRTQRILDLGLYGWRNLPPNGEPGAGFALDNDGKRDPLARRLSSATLDLLPYDLQVELANAIMERSRLTPEQVGN